ncbi:MAG: restriction endonuclease subunit S [Crocinitomicaceae bacterium]
MSEIQTHSKIKKLVPELRFPEFEGDFKNTSLGEIISKLESGVSVNSEDVPAQGDEYGILKTSCVSSGNFYELENKRITDEDIDRAKLNPKEGSIIISRMNTPMLVGESGYVDKTYSNLFIPDRLWQTKISDDMGNARWLSYFLITERMRHSLKTIATGTSDTMKNISKPNFLSLKVETPSLPEQQKIASFLSAVDKKIQQLSRKKALLEQYKKGVMQQIFSQEIRFKPDFDSEQPVNKGMQVAERSRSYPDWVEKRLGEIAKYYDGTHQTPEYVDEGVPFYSVEHVTANQFTKTKFISEEVFQKENERVKLEKGDILLTRIGDIGTTKLIDWDVRASFYVSLALIKQNSKFDSIYLDQFINSDFFQRELWKRTIHVAFPKKINLGEIGSCVVKLPSMKEQQYIGKFLYELESKINALTEKIYDNMEFKKGLLQKMFV